MTLPFTYYIKLAPFIFLENFNIFLTFCFKNRLLVFKLSSVAVILSIIAISLFDSLSKNSVFELLQTKKQDKISYITNDNRVISDKNDINIVDNKEVPKMMMNDTDKNELIDKVKSTSGNIISNVSDKAKYVFQKSSAALGKVSDTVPIIREFKDTMNKYSDQAVNKYRKLSSNDKFLTNIIIFVPVTVVVIQATVYVIKNIFSLIKKVVMAVVNKIIVKKILS